ncbi:hypothetical protein KP509_31G032400 [Ceratopteris richardii]|nr:hypothetical protein KP509_31G032400 [Ceratopteris richardii]
MQCQGVRPNRVTFLAILRACGTIRSLSCIRQAQDNIISEGLDSDVIVANALIDTYAKCGSLHEARCIFDTLQSCRDVVSWSSMISGYVQHGYGLDALFLFEDMQENGVQPANMIYSSILKACGSIGDIQKGREIHYEISILGLISDLVIGNTLIDMYVKCGKVKEARFVFDCLPSHDEVLWGTMIAGYALNGYGFPALELFGEMQRKNVKADRATYLCVLRSCALVGALQEGRLAHQQLTEDHVDVEIFVKNALIDMYAHCTSVADAFQVFNTLHNPDLASWGAIMWGYASCGQGLQVEKSLRQMQQQGLDPDGITFMSILSAYSHAGLLNEGCHYFKCMTEFYNVTPSIEHYNCMIDLLCRAGCLDEAQNLLASIPNSSSIIGLTSLYTGNKVYKSEEGKSLKHLFDGEDSMVKKIKI